MISAPAFSGILKKDQILFMAVDCVPQPGQNFSAPKRITLYVDRDTQGNLKPDGLISFKNKSADDGFIVNATVTTLGNSYAKATMDFMGKTATFEIADVEGTLKDKNSTHKYNCSGK